MSIARSVRSLGHRRAFPLQQLAGEIEAAATRVFKHTHTMHVGELALQRARAHSRFPSQVSKRGNVSGPIVEAFAHEPHAPMVAGISYLADCGVREEPQ